MEAPPSTLEKLKDLLVQSYRSSGGQVSRGQSCFGGPTQCQTGGVNILTGLMFGYFSQPTVSGQPLLLRFKRSSREFDRLPTFDS